MSLTVPNLAAIPAEALPLDVPDQLEAMLASSLPADLQQAMAAAEEFEAHHAAELTIRGQAYMWASFQAWCAEYGFNALPASPQVLAVYIGHLATTGGRVDEFGKAAGRKATTVAQHVSTIRTVHRDHGHPDPADDPYTRRVMRGLRRLKGSKRTRREPMTLARLFDIVDTIDGRSVATRRDHVIVAADALRPRRITAGQLAGLDWADVSVAERGLEVRLPTRGRADAPVVVPIRGGPLCFATAVLSLAAEIADRLGSDQARSGPGAAAVAWSSVFGPVRADGLPSSGPLLPQLNRHAVLQPGRPTRNAIAVRLSRAAHLVGVECARQARPQWTDAQRIDAVTALHEPRLADLRDRALLLLGFALAARRSNLSLLCLDELNERVEGLLVHFRRDKTDQDGHGRDLEVPRRPGPYCPVDAWNRWKAAMIASLGFDPGPTYPAFPALDPSGTRIAGPRAVYKKRTGEVVVDEHDEPVLSHWEGICGDEINNIVKRRAIAAGLDRDPSTGVKLRWGGHSLRRGWMTEAARQGITLERMMAHSGHVTVEVALEYIAEAQRFDPKHSAAMQLEFQVSAQEALPSASSCPGSDSHSEAKEPSDKWRAMGRQLRSSASRRTTHIARSRPS